MPTIDTMIAAQMADHQKLSTMSSPMGHRFGEPGDQPQHERIDHDVEQAQVRM